MKKSTIALPVLLALCLPASAQVDPPEPVPAPKKPVAVNVFQPGVAGGGSGGGAYSTTYVNVSGVPPLVMRFSGGHDEANPAMEEDLNIMTRLIENALEKGLGDESPDVKMGIRMYFSDAARSVRPLYLEGFGALFMIKVGFPVFAPPPAAEAKTQQPPADSEWEKAKRELSTGTEARGAGPDFVFSGGPKYDPTQVEALKTVLVQSFKNATNIRHMNPSDFVAMTVFGHPSATVSTKRSSRPRTTAAAPAAGLTPPTALAPPESPDAPAKEDYETVRKNLSRVERKNAELARQTAEVDRQVAELSRQTVSVRSSGQGTGTVLTLRARKADVDAFANGQLDLDAFKKKVEEHSYIGAGSGVSSLNSWSRGSSGGGTTILR
jgi:hypothetical protein